MSNECCPIARRVWRWFVVVTLLAPWSIARAFGAVGQIDAGLGPTPPPRLEAQEADRTATVLPAGDRDDKRSQELVGCGPSNELRVILNPADPTPVVMKWEVSEHCGAATLVLHRTGSLDQGWSLLVYTGDGTAKAGVDYQAVNTRITFSPGVAELTITVPLVNDDILRTPRTFWIDLSNDFFGSSFSWTQSVLIQDDDSGIDQSELEVLEQRIYDEDLPSGWRSALSKAPPVATPGGRMLVRSSAELIRLGTDGLPDLSWGENGRVFVPGLDSEQITASIRIEVSGQQGFAIHDPTRDRVFFLDGDGQTQSGTGDPWRTLPSSPSRGFPTVNGYLWNYSLEDGSSQVGFSSYDGQMVPGFPLPGRILYVAANGRFAVRSEDFETGFLKLAWYLPDGRPDPESVPLEDLPSWMRFWTDAEDRVYGNIGDFGPWRGLEGPVFRFLPDNTLDADYVSPPLEVMVREPTIHADGSIAISDGDVLTRWLPNGTRAEVPLPQVNALGLGGLASMVPLEGGQIRLEFEECIRSGWGWVGWWFCSLTGETYLQPDGSLKGTTRSPLTPSPRAAIEGDGEFWAIRDQTLVRRRVPAPRPEIGIPTTGLQVLEDGVRLPIQRSGSTAGEATVRGRVWEWRRGRWVERMDLPLEVTFPVGRSQVMAEWPGVAQPGRQGLRLFLVRLESATGADLSSFTACRLWVWDPESLPQTGTLTLEHPDAEGPNAQGLLAARLQGAQKVQVADQPAGPWLDLESMEASFNSVTLPGVRLWHLGTTVADRRFFRVHPR